MTKLGPPAKTWSLAAHITIAVLRNFLNRSSKITVEEIQKLSTAKKLPIPFSISSKDFTVPNTYRKTAGDSLKKVLTQGDEKAIDWDWEKDRETSSPIKGEWLQSKGNIFDPRKESTILYLHGGAYYIGCYGLYRHFLCNLIKVCINLLKPSLVFDTMCVLYSILKVASVRSIIV